MLLQIVLPLLVSAAFIAAMSLLREPARQQLSALLVAGAGATYFGAGLGFWEIAFCALLTWLAFKTLTNYRFAALGWALHVAWDVVHHLHGHAILPFVPLSSAGCAICDMPIALWYFLGAPSLLNRSAELRTTRAHV